MIRILTIVGARPQIIKAAALSRVIKSCYADKIEESILHTGQHYDANMSLIFFEELGIALPYCNLNVGSGTHGEQTAKMMTGIEKILQGEHFDGVVLYGDTNSTLAGAMAASKLHIPIFHIEAGLRSYNMTMPEEINRIICDQLSSVLFAPTHTAIDNLRREGFESSPSVFKNKKKRQVYNSGDVMYDNSMYYAKIAERKSTILQQYGLLSNDYVLVTIHRDNNTDCKERLSAIFYALLQLIDDYHIQVVLPLHPRTSKLLKTNVSKELLQRIEQSNHILILPPVSFLDMISLEKNAKLVMTDSGGVQKEAFFFEKPCIILRPETEWIEIIDSNAGIIADADFDHIIRAYESLSVSKVVFPNLFGNARASHFIADRIIAYFS